jgi:hypothetical protein
MLNTKKNFEDFDDSFVHMLTQFDTMIELVSLQEVEDLKTELDTCEQRLESKYKAIDILRKQVNLTFIWIWCQI